MAGDRLGGEQTARRFDQRDHGHCRPDACGAPVQILGLLGVGDDDPGKTWGCRAAVEVDEEVVSSGRVHPNPGRCPRQPRSGGGAGLFLALSRYRILEVDDEPVRTGGRGNTVVEALRAWTFIDRRWHFDNC